LSRPRAAVPAPDGAELELAVGAILRLDAVRSDARRHVGWLEIAAAEELAQQDVASADEPTAGDDEAPYACTNGYYYYRCTSETCTTCDRHGYKKRKFYCAYGELYPTSTWVCRLPRAGVSRCYYSIGCSG